MRTARATNRLWHLASAPVARAFERALEAPEAAQWRLLRGYLRRNAGTAYGRRHGFAAIRSVAEFQSRVPIVGYEELAPYAERICRGERGVLSAEPVRRLVPSSGSTDACKLVPWTSTFGAEFRRAVGAWIHGLFERRPDLRRGPAYWSVSPAIPEERRPGAALPVGFGEDTACLGGLLAPVVRGALAVPETLRHVREPETLRYLTALGLLRCGELRLLSVWHPSFFTLLLEAAERHWPALVADVARGGLTPPGAVPEKVGRVLRTWRRPDPARARALERAGPRETAAVWPHLGLVSCWADGPATLPAAELAARLPAAELQPKGLLATEGVVSLPFGGSRPAAVTSHFLEVVDREGRARTVSELREGEIGAVVLTTGAGFVRYRLGDLVRVDGFLGRTPCLRFVGRVDAVSDLRGEKLSAGFVGGALETLLADRQPRFALLAPERPQGRPRYTLYVEPAGGEAAVLPADLALRLDDALSENPHYQLCRRLGQLAPPAVFQVSGGGDAAYLEREREAGRRLGEVKPSPLSTRAGWSERFDGAYLHDGSEAPRPRAAPRPARCSRAPIAPWGLAEGTRSPGLRPRVPGR